METREPEHLPDEPRWTPLLLAAERACGLHGVRLTPLRRSVLELLAMRETPRSAYDIRDALCARQGRSVAPITVYRALKFLCKMRLVTRLETRNAYVARPDPSAPGARVLLICDACGRVQSVEGQAVLLLLATGASDAGFLILRETLEIEGICHACTDASAPTANPTGSLASRNRRSLAGFPRIL